MKIKARLHVPPPYRASWLYIPASAARALMWRGASLPTAIAEWHEGKPRPAIMLTHDGARLIVRVCDATEPHAIVLRRHRNTTALYATTGLRTLARWLQRAPEQSETVEVDVDIEEVA